MLTKTGNVSVNVTLRRVCLGQAIIIICSECVFCSLSCLSFKRPVRHVFLSSVTSLALSYFSTSSHKLFDFGGGGREELLNLKCGFWLTLQLASKTFPIITRIQRDILGNIRRFLRKVSLILDMFWWNFNFFPQICEKHSVWNLIKILPVGAELSEAYGRTDAFRKFCKSA